MKKQLLSIILALLPMLAMADDSGSCGDNVTYTFVSSTGTLTIQGSGAMKDNSSESSVPWYSYRTNIKTVIIEDGVTSIGDGAFWGCTGLTSVTIPNSVTSIGNCIFWDCLGLTSVTIPNSVTSIGYGAFVGCSGLTSVEFHCAQIGSWFSGNKSIKEIVIGNEVTSIGNQAFRDCSGLTSITIPNSVTSIGEYAFSGCSGLTSVTIGNSVTSIEGAAFYGCSGLTSVTIPNSVTSIGYQAFYNCSGLTSVTIGNSVTSIGSFAFCGCSSLTSVTIGNSVTSIEGRAFEGCSSLTSVTIPNSVTSIGEIAFRGCSGLQKVIVPDIAAWCGISFGDNPLNYAHHIYSDEDTEITDLVIPNSVTSIGSGAFQNCSGLTSVTIPNSVTSIGSGAFQNCSGLQKVIVPDIAAWCGISFGDNPLYYANHIYSDENTEIKDLVIPNSVTSIGRGAFRYCSDLTSVTIGNSVTSIGASAFSGCSGLTSVYSMIENVFTINYNTFDTNTYSNAKLYVPIGKKAVYKGTEPWKQFTNIEEYDYSTGIAAPQMGKDVKVVDAYQLNGMKRNGVQRGLNIIRMSDGTTRKVVVK